MTTTTTGDDDDNDDDVDDVDDDDDNNINISIGRKDQQRTLSKMYVPWTVDRQKLFIR